MGWMVWVLEFGGHEIFYTTTIQPRGPIHLHCFYAIMACYRVTFTFFT